MNPERRPCWTTWQDSKLAEMWEAGASCNIIATRLGTTKNAVAGRRMRLNLPPRRNLVQTSAQQAALVSQVAELLAGGADFVAIARQMGTTYDTVRGMFNRICIELGEQAR